MGNKLSIAISLMIVMLQCTCMKGTIEHPPTVSADPMISVNATVAGIISLLDSAGVPQLIEDELTIAVTVSANDLTANFYNEIVAEDSTAGISIQINADNLFQTYPVGCKIYVRLKGMFLSRSYGLPQLGGTPAPDNNGVLQVSALNGKLADLHLVPAGPANVLRPRNVSMKDLATTNFRLLNTLVKIDEAEVASPTSDIIYSETAFPTSVRITDCSGTSIYMRTSNYATFSAARIPWGKGSITGVYSVYKNTPQIIIRDTADVDFKGARCDGSLYESAVPVSIAEVRKSYKGSDTTLGSLCINGIVISDAANKNTGTGSIVLQDGPAGILIFFGSTSSDIPDLGDSITVDISGSVLTSYNGALEIKNIKSSRIKIIAGNRAVQPSVLTIGELNANFTQYESTLVTIKKARIKESGTYSGNKTLDDGTGTITLFTSSSATFSTEPVPAISKAFTGIVTPYNAVKEIKLRNTALDVK